MLEFGEIRKKRLAVTKTLDVERERMRMHIRFVYYMLGYGFINAWVATLYPFQISEIRRVPIFS